MNIHYHGQNIDVSDEDRDRVEEHLARLSRYLKVMDSVQVTLTKERHLVKAEVHVTSKSLKLFGTAATPDSLISIDKAMDRIVEQCRRYKKKLQHDRTHRDYSNVPDAEFGITTINYSPEEEEKKPEIVKTERLVAKPMDLEEAIMQMDLMNSEFLVFINAKSQKVNVIYRRKDKHLGLIET
jgi:putative sigma-54 modulation protein